MKINSTFILYGLLFVLIIVLTGQMVWAKRSAGTYAVLKIKGAVKGKIVCRLFTDEAPKTVENFTGLAQGAIEWLDPETGQKKKSPFFRNFLFHRIIPQFMIQGGDPTGTGRGGPGYQFDDEFAVKQGSAFIVQNGVRPADIPNLVRTFDRPGLLAMANAGPGTNGSQFFITTVPTPWLNGHHTIFGEVIEGMDIVMKMEKVERGPGDKPIKAIILERVDIETSK